MTRYLPPSENTWTPMTLAIALLTAISFGQAGGVFCVGYTLSIVLSVCCALYVVETFGLVLCMLGVGLLAGVGGALYWVVSRQRSKDFLRLLEENEEQVLTI
jgi:hypothetical protein